MAAALVVAALLTKRESIALAAVALLGGAYAGALYLDGVDVDARAPLFAALLVLLPELVGWSIQAATPMAADPAIGGLRIRQLALVALASAAAASLVVGVTVVETSGGLAWEAVGVTAAVGALALLVWAGRA